jgi:hypothetical protein
MTTRYVIDASEALRVVGVRGDGDLDKERVLIRAVAPVNLIRFLILNATFTGPNQIRDLNRKVFWFPSHNVASGDYVRIYSRTGVAKSHSGKFSGLSTTYHDFFWNRTLPIWEGKSSAVVLIEVAAWDAKEAF